MNMLDMLREMGGAEFEDREERAPSSPPDVLCKTLREVADRYAAGCQFKVGDLVTPRKGYNIKDEGRPHIVVDVRHNAVADLTVPPDTGEIGNVTFGSRMDIRTAHEARGTMVMHWNESWQFEPYTGPGSEA